MTQAGTIDTHRMVKRLIGSGMAEPQAEAVVDLIKEQHDGLVTRDVLRYELALVEERIATQFEAMQRRIDGVEERIATRFEAMDRRIDGVEERLGRRIDGVEVRVDTLGKDLTIRLGGMLAAAVALVGALVAIF